ncbi:MAG: hypothetical protein WCN92_01530 [Eubacteriales bacterium]
MNKIDTIEIYNTSSGTVITGKSKNTLHVEEIIQANGIKYKITQILFTSGSPADPDIIKLLVKPD